MALSKIIKHAADGGTIVLKDGTGTPITLTLRYDGADLQLSGLSQYLREHTVYQNRGKIRSVRRGQVTIPRWSLSLEVADLSEATTGTVINWIHKVAPFASPALVSTIDFGDVFGQTLFYTMEGTDLGDSADQTIELTKITIDDYDFTEGSPNKLMLRGSVYGDYKVNGATVATVPVAS
jgi:hypothetical protein